MRKLIVHLILASLLFSCKDEVTPPGWFKINGENKILSKGFVDPSDDSGDFYRWNIFLHSIGFQYDGKSLNTIKGTGDDIFFSLRVYDNDANELPEGTYPFNEYPYNGTENAIQGGLVDVDYTWNAGLAHPYRINGGSLTILKKGKNYVITFNLTMETGEMVNGIFNGRLQSAVFL